MPQPNDLSRSLVALDQDRTMIAVVEMSQSRLAGLAVCFPALSVSRAKSCRVPPGDAAGPPDEAAASGDEKVPAGRIQHPPNKP